MEHIRDLNSIISLIRNEVMSSNDKYWVRKLATGDYKNLHLAIMIEPYLSLLLNGNKTIESRFSRNKIIPYQKIDKGDIIILKKSGGQIVGLFEADGIDFFNFSNGCKLEYVKEKYNDRLLIKNDFWEEKKDSMYATLIGVNHLVKLKPINLNMANRKSWIILENKYEQISII